MSEKATPWERTPSTETKSTEVCWLDWPAAIRAAQWGLHQWCHLWVPRGGQAAQQVGGGGVECPRPASESARANGALSWM